MSEFLIGELVQWYPDKGYGFLMQGSRRIFLHRNQLAGGAGPPKIGASIRFSLGKDVEGRTCAVNAFELGRSLHQPPARPARALRPSREHRLEAGHVFYLLLLLVGPGLALHRLAWPPATVGIAAVALSAVTYLTYALDKMRAQSRDWRIPESTLHGLGLLGGWPGAFLAQQRIRHKNAKVSFQVVFWLTVAAWQYAALDYLLEWKMARFIAATVSQWLGR